MAIKHSKTAVKAPDCSCVTTTDWNACHTDTFISSGDIQIWKDPCSCTWFSKNVSSGAITCSTNERCLLQTAICSFCDGGTIVIKQPNAQFVVGCGITISMCNIHIIGEPSGISSVTSNPPHSIRFQTGVACTTLFTVTGCEVSLENIQIHMAGTGQTGLRLTDSSRGYYNNLSFSGAFCQAIYLYGCMTLTNGNEFGNIFIQNPVGGIRFNANSMCVGDSIAATVNHFSKVIITGATSYGVWLENKADNNIFDFLQTPTPVGACVSNIIVGSACGISFSGNYIGKLVAGTSNIANFVLDIYSDSGQTVHTPITIACYNRDGTVPTTPINLRAGAKKPVILNEIKGTCNTKGLRISEISVSGVTECVIGQGVNDPTFGSLRIPFRTTANNCVSDCDFGNANGSIGINCNNNTPYFKDGIWRKFAITDNNNLFSADQTICKTGSPTNWNSVRPELLSAGTNIGQYKFQAFQMCCCTTPITFAQIDGRVSTTTMCNYDGYLDLRIADAGVLDTKIRMRGNVCPPIILLDNVNFCDNNLTNVNTITFFDGQVLSTTINTLNANTCIFNISRDDDTQAFLYLTHDAATSNNERLVDFNFRGRDNTCTLRVYGGFVGRAETVTSCAIDGSLELFVAENNVNTTYIQLDANSLERNVKLLKPTVFPSFSDCTRPCPMCVTAGTVIYNTTDGGLNVSHACMWRAPCGGWVDT